MSSFAERLYELRTARGLSQQRLAEEIGMSKSSVSMYEVQEIVADYFNVDIDYLTGRSDRTTIVMSGSDANPQRRFLMDKIAKADEKKLDRIRKLMELIDEESDNR